MFTHTSFSSNAHEHPDDCSILVTDDKRDFLCLEDPTSQFGKAVILMLPEEQAVVDRLRMEAVYRAHPGREAPAVRALASELLLDHLPTEWSDAAANVNYKPLHLDNPRRLNFHRDGSSVRPFIRVLRVLLGENTLYYLGKCPPSDNANGFFRDINALEQDKIHVLPFNAIVAFWAMRSDRGFEQSFMHSWPQYHVHRAVVQTNVYRTPR